MPYQAFIPRDNLLDHLNNDRAAPASSKFELKLSNVKHENDQLNAKFTEGLDFLLDIANTHTTEICAGLGVSKSKSRKTKISNAEFALIEDVLSGWYEQLMAEKYIPLVRRSAFGDMDLPAIKFILAEGVTIGIIDTEGKVLKIKPASLKLQTPVLSADNLKVITTRPAESLKNKFDTFLVELTDKNKNVIGEKSFSATQDRVFDFNLFTFITGAVGVMAAWWWWRYIRSYLVEAFGYGFDMYALINGVKYEEWVARAQACFLCWALHGQVWKEGEGPEPVISTHPHCMCSRRPHYSTTSTVQPTYYPRPPWI